MRKLLLLGALVVLRIDAGAQTPVIYSFTPYEGPAGTTTVTISGNNFSAVSGNNIVYFGATKATLVNALSSTQLQVTVPIGSTYQPVSVTVGGLSATYSGSPFVVTFPSSGTFSSSSFATKVDFGTGTNPVQVAMGDIDGDGKSEIIVTNFASASLSIFRNLSSAGSISGGSFSGHVDFTTGTQPLDLAIVDLDSDGKLDIAVSNSGSSSISVFRNTSTIGAITTGSLASKVDFVTGTTPYGIAARDIDGDGKPDLAVANSASNTMSILRNTGTSGVINSASFAGKVDFTTGALPYSIAIADLDGDGSVDLAVSNAGGNSVSVFRNSAIAGTIDASSLATKLDLTTENNSYKVVAGDIDGDNKLDLVVANAGSNTISILKNNSTPGSLSFASKIDFFPGATPLSACLTDLTGDGLIDIAVPNNTGGNISILKNAGVAATISASSFGSAVNFTAGTNPYDIAAGDLDGDGKPDLVITENTTNTVSVYRNLLSGSQPAPTISSFLPTTGSSGTPVTITGTNFDATTLNNNIVKFNGIVAVVTAASSTSITTTVPAGASTGTITVTVGGQIGTSSTNFVIATPAPSITSFNPSSGTVGTTVTISGTNFEAAAANNIVKFNGTAANVTSSTSTTIITSVPSGASSGPISVTVGGQTATSSLSFTVDTTPPLVSANSTPSSTTIGIALDASATFSDPESGISSASVLYRPVAGAAPNNFTTLSMTLSGTSYQAKIPASAISELGVEYKYLIVNGAGLDNSASQTLYRTVISYPSGLNLSSYPSTAGGTDVVNYRIIAVPLILDNKTANGVFNNVLGGYDPTIWRMFKYNGTGFTELNGNSTLIPGEGYWFIAASSSPLSLGSGTTVDVTASSPFSITLNPGWNQIGNPYNFNISWADIIAVNPSNAANLGGNNSRFRVYRGAVDNVDVLKAMEGGFVKFLGTTATPINIPVAKNVSIQGRISTPGNADLILDKPIWEMPLTLTNGKNVNRIGGIGMHPEAMDGFDYHDDFNSPRFIDYLEVKFPKSYFGMSYAKDVVPPSENHTWNFSVETNISEAPTTLSWISPSLDPGRSIFLLDVAENVFLDMSLINKYTFDQTRTNGLKIILGRSDYVKSELVPTAAFLNDPYPNPAIEKIVIRYALPSTVALSGAEVAIFNLQGSKIYSMFSTDPGPGTVEWKSEDYSPGLYFVKLTSGSQVIVKKILKR